MVGLCEGGNEPAISLKAICKLWKKFQEAHSVANRPREGRQRKTTPTQDQYVRISALRRPTTSTTTLHHELHEATEEQRKILSCTGTQTRDVPSTSSSHNVAFSNYGSSSSVCIPGGVEGQDVNSDSSQLTALQTFSVGNAFGLLLSRCHMGLPEPISVNTVEGSDRVEVSTCPSPRAQESLVNHGRVISDSLECEHNTFSVTFDLNAHMGTVSQSMTANSAENNNTTNDITVLLERPKKGRKRKNPDQNRDDRKRKCQLNQPYINQKGKVVKPKEFRDFQCNSKCNERVGIEDRKKEFEIFWNLESYEAKALYVASKVMVGRVRRKRTKGESRRHCTRIYTLAGVQVCKLCFTQTLRISGDRIDGYLKKTTLNFADLKKDCAICGQKKMECQVGRKTNTSDIFFCLSLIEEQRQRMRLETYVPVWQGCDSDVRIELTTSVPHESRSHRLHGTLSDVARWREERGCITSRDEFARASGAGREERALDFSGMPSLETGRTFQATSL
ncbi:hypothetical protein ANN_00251 [Periplaneta americana]|uniref:Uncharacterized protein n=1 Tax=Periplaneta americana TaxID=6978 RepID=A0ABQ8TU82_PERAM|nr:hypothetical protein ANN_00251 [Periplaneta americana]